MATTKKTESAFPDYKSDAKEKGYVHVELRVGGFSTQTGEPLFKPYMQKMEPKSEWPNFYKNKGGINVIKVHNLPTGAKSVEELDKEIKAASDKEAAKYKKAR